MVGFLILAMNATEIENPVTDTDLPVREFHPVSEIFPLMTGTAFDELVADIAENGLREPIWLHDGKIIDGRNRYNACIKAGLIPSYRQWNGEGDLTKFVISLNLHRRHLNESQRAMIGAKLATRPIGGNRRWDEARIDAGISAPISPAIPTVPEAAEMLNVNKSSVSTAKKVRREGVPEVVAAVESGEISLHAAKAIAAEPRERQPEALAEHKKPKSERTAPTNGKSKTYTKTHPGRKAPQAIRGAIGTLVGLATGLDSFTAKDAAPTKEESRQWERDLLSVISAVNRFRRQLRELHGDNANAKENGDGEA